MSALPAVAAGGRGRDIAIVALLALGQAMAAGAAAFATRDIFAALAADIPVAAGALAVLALSGLAIAGCRVGERVVAERVGQRYAEALRLRLFTHLARLPGRQVAGRRAGGLALRFTGDLAAIRGWVSLGIARLIAAAIVLPMALAVVCLLNPALGAAAAVPVAVGLGAMALLGHRFAPAHDRLRRRRSTLAARMAERVAHAPELRLLGRLSLERRALRRHSARMIGAAMTRARGAALMLAVPDAVSGLAAAGVLTVAASGRAGAAETAGALAALALMVQPLRDLAGVWDRRRAFLAAAEKCRALLAQDRLPKGRREAGAAAAAGPKTAAAVSFRKLSGATIRDLSLRVAPGQRIAVLGPNGAGKSELLALAAGLEAPSAGRVLIDGRPVARLDDRARGRLICHVTDRSPILAGSLRRALTLGGRRAGDPMIEAAARTYGLGVLLSRLGGLDGRIVEGGRNLSAGERRRLLLARAALSDAPLLLLDEPDDALDAEAVALMSTLLAATPATVLMVTHNPAVARLADEGWLLEGGRLAGRGPLDDLLRPGPAAA